MWICLRMSAVQQGAGCRDPVKAVMRGIALSLGLSVLICQSVVATTRYVDGSVSSSGDGNTWDRAFRTIQEGIDAATDGDTVVVAQGTYVENIHFYGLNIVLRSTNPWRSDVVASTIIDGNQVESVVIFSGTEDETCTLAGFTIQNGYGRYGGKYGAGIYGSMCRATIRNNIIARNRAPST